MKTGTKSLLFGVHQFLWHPLTVWLAWVKMYRTLPSIGECVAIFIHDWGYWGCHKMDDDYGERHPERSAQIMFRLCRFFRVDNNKTARLCGLIVHHSRYLSARHGTDPSMLCWPDKASIQFEPSWFYLLRARLSGELYEYRLNASYHITMDRSDKAWFAWIQLRCLSVAHNKTVPSSRGNP